MAIQTSYARFDEDPRKQGGRSWSLYPLVTFLSEDLVAQVTKNTQIHESTRGHIRAVYTNSGSPPYNPMIYNVLCSAKI